MMRLVALDLDNSLTDMVRNFDLCLSIVLCRLGKEKFSIDEIRTMVGGGSMKMVELGFPQNGGVDSCAHLEEVYFDFITENSKKPSRATSIFPSGSEILNYLREQGIRLALCIINPRADTGPVIKKLKVQKYFFDVCCGDEIPFQKTDGRHIGHILKPMKRTPNQAVVIGDRKTDLETAHYPGSGQLLFILAMMLMSP